MVRRFVVFFLVQLDFGESACLNSCNLNGKCVGEGSSAHCSCDPEFTGVSCEIAHCPRGDDPLTRDQKERSFRLQIVSDRATTANTRVNGTVKIRFLGSQRQMPASSNELNNAICSHTWSQLLGISRAQCNRIEADAFGNGVYHIRIIEWTQTPVDAQEPHFGNPSLSAFECDSTAAAPEGLKCILSDLNNEDVKEHVECSNHGFCGSDGQCQCHSGWYGKACSENLDSDDVALHAAEGPFFSGTLLRLRATRPPDTSFSVIAASSAGIPTFVVRGNGDMQVSGSVSIQGELSVLSDVRIDGGLLLRSLFVHNDLQVHGTVTLSAVKIHGEMSVDQHAEFQEGLVVSGQIHANSDLHVASNLNVAGVFTASQNFGLIIDTNLVVGRSESLSDDMNRAVFQVNPPAQNHLPYLLRIGNDMLSVDAQGLVTSSSGLRIVGGGLDVQSGGLNVNAGGVKVQGGLEILTGELTVTEGALRLMNGLEVKTSLAGAQSALRLEASHTHFGGSLLDLNSNGQTDHDFISAFSVTGKKSDKSIKFSVDSKGNVQCAGGHFRSTVNIGGALEADGALRLKRYSMPAATYQKFDAESAAFLEISDDSKLGTNMSLHLSAPTSTMKSVPLRAGLLVIQNNDKDIVRISDDSHQDITSVPAGRAVIMTQTAPGMSWKPVTATVEAGDLRHLSNIESLSASRDLDIGPFAFTANDLQVSSLEPGGVVFVDPISKKLVTKKSLISFSQSSGAAIGSQNTDESMLHCHSIRAHRLMGPLDINGNALRRARLEASDVVGAGVVTAMRLGVTQRDVKDPRHPPNGFSRLALFEPGGQIEARPELYLKDDTLRIPKIDIDSVVASSGIINFNNVSITNANLLGGSVSGLEEISLERLRFDKMDNSFDDDSDSEKDWGMLAVIDKTGELMASHRLVQDSTVTNNKELHQSNAFKPILASADGSLAISSLQVKTLASDIDANQFTIRNANIEFGAAAGLDFVAADAVLVVTLPESGVVFAGAGGSLEASSTLRATSNGDLYAAGKIRANNLATDNDAIVGGSLVVGGTVMGSGPYVDSSDARFKTNLRPVSSNEAISALSHLIAYRYQHLKSTDTDPQLGFLAQHAHRTSFGPELVKTNEQGDMFVAYTRIGPLLAAAFNGVISEVGQLRRDYDAISKKLDDLLQIVSDCDVKKSA